MKNGEHLRMTAVRMIDGHGAKSAPLPTLRFYIFCEGKVSFCRLPPTQLGYGIASPGTIGQKRIGCSLLKRFFHFAS